MTSAFLQSELTSLVADSKKRSTDVRAAAEKSLADLKSIVVTSEVQLAADLFRSSHFIDPFVLACQTRHAKLTNSATACLQRLVASRAVPNERLEDVINGFRDAMNASYDTQLKILQTLPALLQLYASEVRGQLLARILEICVNLESSKTNLVSSSARATFEQLVDSVFERARVETQSDKAHAKKSSTASLSNAADDASRIFEDLCSILNGSEPTYLHVDISSSLFLLDTIEKILDGNAPYIRSKPYLIEACRAQLLPGLAALLREKDDFHQIAQSLRICHVILSKLPQLLDDMQDVFGIVLRFLDRDSSMWKRVLALEFFQQLCSNFGLIMRSFDTTQNHNEVFVVKLMATIVRIAAEDPTLIGLGRQSTVPVHSGRDAREDEMASIEAQGIGGGGLASVSSADAGATGISVDFSTIEKRLLEDDESATIPLFPKTYLYALILECISSFCEGLSKFIMPLSVSSKYLESSERAVEEEGEAGAMDQVVPAKVPRRSTPGYKYQRLANPLKMSGLPQLQQVRACSTMIDSCWPAILATCSTFLNAALDSHFYHVLIRSMQKLAQVSGTLELGTPRDALLTSLAKGSVPPNAAAIITLAQASEDDQGDDVSNTNGLKSPAAETSRNQTSAPRQSLNVRHLLCLRALLNLGIALGPTLTQESWFIVIETLQQVETLMSVAGTGRSFTSTIGSKSNTGQQEAQTSLASEMSAVNAATMRMFESTRSYADDSFAAITNALLRMVGDAYSELKSQQREDIVQSPATLASPTIRKRSHNASRSVSGLWTKTKALDVEVTFVLARTKDLARVNLHRFTSTSSTACTWDLIIPRLLNLAKGKDVSRELRLQSASIVDLIAMEVMKLLSHDTLTEDEIDQVQCKSLDVLANQVSPEALGTDSSEKDSSLREELYKRVFEALENILGHSGDSFRSAWDLVFQVLRAGVVPGHQDSEASFDKPEASRIDLTRVTPVAFRCIQLICNDFLQLLDGNYLQRLIELLFSFGAQAHNLNMSLTTTGLLQNVASLLETRAGSIDVLREGFSQLSLGNHKHGQTAPDYLWALTVTQLRQICSDRRVDVRDASVRILLQVLESASEKITPKSFALALDAHLFSVMRNYQEIIAQSDAPDLAYSASLAKLIEGTTNLMSQNIQGLVIDAIFEETWERLLEVLSEVLAQSTTSLRTLIFESLAKLLEALKESSKDPSDLVTATLSLWALYAPSEEAEGETAPNQSVLAAYVNLFVQASATSPGGTSNFAPDLTHAADHAMRSVRCALLTARHPPYTNDARKRTTEQDAAFEALRILGQMLKSTPDRYVAFLLELIHSMLLTPHKELVTSVQTTSLTKKVQKPTYIAVASDCLDLLRRTAEDKTISQAAWTPTQLQSSLQTLSSLINTKYTPLPTNPDAPLWQNATTTTVAILEGTRLIIRSLQTNLTSEETIALNEGVISCLTSIIGPGGLETLSPPPSAEKIAEDESFDISHFQRFQSTSSLLLSSPNTPSEQRKQYILTLFHASLVAKPWFNDFPFASATDTATSPLKSLMTLRSGSVHPPKFPRRSRMPYAALDALFNMLEPQTAGFERPMAIEAAPYLLLRVAHPMKVLLADQSLRGLTPLPMKLQEEMRWVLERCLSSKVDDEAFARAVARSKSVEVSKGDNGNTGKGEEGRGSTGTRIRDGKSHLRILFGLILKTQKGWREMMRLPDGKGWQDDLVGKGIQRALEAWIESVGEGWGVPEF